MRNGMAWTVFPTAIGFVGLAWGEAGLLGAQLPEADEAGTRARMARRFPALVEVGPADLAAAAAQALGHNPFAPVVPCHRVLGADGRPGGFSAHGAALTKLRMLAIEGARPQGTASLFPF